MANPFVHVELQTQDLGLAKKFYRGLFDWNYEAFPGMDYTVIKVGEGTGGGMMKSPGADGKSQWIPYILVDDVAAATEKAKSLAGAALVEVTEIPDMGWYSVMVDPTGAVFGMVQPKPMK